MNIVEVSVSSLNPYENNARTHSKEQVEEIAESIRRFGFTNPILVDDKNTIIAGHGRLQGAKAVGLEKVPTLCLSHLSPTEVRAYVLADNQLALNAGWDTGLLAKELNAIYNDDNSLIDLLGFDADYLSSILDDENYHGNEGNGGGGEDGTDYSKKIEAPVYEPTGAKPEISELLNTEKCLQLVREIKALDIGDDEKQFLIKAAYRHNVFNYQNIAEYYAHSSKQVQDLMEKSALVVIDFDKAIENGFVSMSENILESFKNDAN